MAGIRGVIAAATFAALCGAVFSAPAQGAGDGQPKTPAAAPLEAEALASEIVGLIGGLDPRTGSSGIQAALHRRLLRAARADAGAQEASRPVIADALGLVLSEELTSAQRRAVFDLFRAYAGPGPGPAPMPIEAAATSPTPALLLETLGPPPSIHGAGGSDYTAH